MQEALIQVNIYKFISSIIDKMSFLRAFPKLRKYIPKIKEIRTLPSSSFGYNLKLMVKSNIHKNLTCNRYLWSQSKRNKFGIIGKSQNIYSMDDITKRADVYVRKNGTLVIQRPFDLLRDVKQENDHDQ